jgi:ketosteroid isomerase-like protein
MEVFIRRVPSNTVFPRAPRGLDVPASVVIARPPWHRDTAHAVSQQVELVRRVFDAFREEGPDAVFAVLAPDIEWTVRPDLPDAKTYRGREGVRQLLATFEDVLDDQWYTALEFIEAGQQVIVPLRWGARGKASGVPFEEREETWVFALREGKVDRVTEYATKKAALKSSPHAAQ